VATNITPHIFK